MISGLNAGFTKALRSRNTQTLALLVFALCGAQGCVLLEKPTTADPSAMIGGEIPAHWSASGSRVPGTAMTAWVSDFRSDILQSLTREAVSGNYSLAAARARVAQIEERAVRVNSDRLPQVDASLSSGRSQNLRGANFQTVTATNYNLGFDFSWELDIWGRVKNLRDAQLDLAAAESNVYHWSRLSIAASVVKTALEIAESRQQIALSRKNLKSLRTNLDILDSKLEAGDANDRTALEISLSKADIARAESNILVEERQLDGSLRNLETLVGRYPRAKIQTLYTLPQISRNIPTGLPSELLLRRPDLLAAESRVDARLKDLAASRKALLPSIRMTSGTGTNTTREFEDLFNVQNLVWNIGGNLARPLYAGGQLRSDIRISQHEVDEMSANYADTTLTAFREVETALSAEQYLRRQMSALEKSVREASRAEELSLSQYEKGLVDIITLLESQRRYFDAESNLLNVQLLLLRNRVDLYLALGGDFDHPLIQEK